ncbi:TetR/AcrR family transcriptional regulator [Saccharomonospora xinjiangensis]|uniref:Transcriptional regulator n=1 Tax=Saccharomonospora xinjiangensis XJ-54 TaxID=882086 RepID=I0UX56_9PSEU|nr:TetR/AcrR family transcriptional regulator [Saccharomonospora xinjiangensis]EID52459.1 transcriptional regulator [Saccharomonospora xinjiangensis XJ-54]
MGKGESTKRSILDTASELASEVGLQALTIGTLATRTELSKSGLFAHFRSKEALQLEVLRHARARFVDIVVKPALAAPRGETRVRTLFEHWLPWVRGDVLPGGCVFTTAATEFDDQPGPVRDQLVADERDLMDSVAQIFRTGIAEGHFHTDADPEQFAQDLHGILLAYLHAERLLRDPLAEHRARTAFERLLDAARR